MVRRNHPRTICRWNFMRAETQSIVDEIKQGIGLLRRHL